MNDHRRSEGFKFTLGQNVTIDVSNQQGTVTARCEYINAEPAYEVLYATKDGDATKRFWSESYLRAAT